MDLWQARLRDVEADAMPVDPNGDRGVDGRVLSLARALLAALDLDRAVGGSEQDVLAGGLEVVAHPVDRAQVRVAVAAAAVRGDTRTWGGTTRSARCRARS